MSKSPFVYEDYLISNYIQRICILGDTCCMHKNDYKLNVCEISLTIILLIICQRIWCVSLSPPPFFLTVHYFINKTGKTMSRESKGRTIYITHI
jgi:hypothetical protein